MSLLPEPNMNAKPNAQNSRPHRQVSTMPSSRMLTVSRVREKPASSIMKPACMKNTRNAASSVHIVLSGLIRSAAVGVPLSARASAPKYHETPAMPPIRMSAPSILPATMAVKIRREPGSFIRSMNRFSMGFLVGVSERRDGAEDEGQLVGGRRRHARLVGERLESAERVVGADLGARQQAIRRRVRERAGRFAEVAFHRERDAERR